MHRKHRKKNDRKKKISKMIYRRKKIERKNIEEDYAE